MISRQAEGPPPPPAGLHQCELFPFPSGYLVTTPPVVQQFTPH